MDLSQDHALYREKSISHTNINDCCVINWDSTTVISFAVEDLICEPHEGIGDRLLRDGIFLYA
jgi:hypothetical protein